ncbi:MAG: glycosyltransferase family 2 protein [Arenimonas sp.]
MNPLVSVIIPCYNAERWVLETLESVKKQTYENIEIIIVNDGSTDKSAELIRSFQFPSIRVFEQENKGQTAALNAGLALANGDFVQYLDADDLLHPDKIEIQVKRLLQNPGCIASAEWVRFYDTISDVVFQSDATWQDMLPVDWLVESWKEGGGMLFPAMWLLPTEIAKNISGWNEELTLNNDADYFVRAILASEKILFCAGAKTYYRSGIAGSLSGMKSQKGWLSQWKVLKNCESYLLEKENSERTRRAVSMLWQRFAYASYPYSPELGNTAAASAKTLHPAKLELEGGTIFRFFNSMFGWRLAVILQKKYYAIRYGRA